MVPVGEGLMAAPEGEPVRAGGGRAGPAGGRSRRLVSGIMPGRRVAAVRAGSGQCLGVGVAPEVGGDDGADGQGGHDQDGVPAIAV